MLTRRAKKETPKKETDGGAAKKLVTGYISIDLIEKIKAEAKLQRRSQTGMVSIILEDWDANHQ